MSGCCRKSPYVFPPRGRSGSRQDDHGGTPRQGAQAAQHRRVHLLCPAPSTIQWQDELRTKFDERFVIMSSDYLHNVPSGNPWATTTSASRPSISPSARSYATWCSRRRGTWSSTKLTLA